MPLAFSFPGHIDAVIGCLHLLVLVSTICSLFCCNRSYELNWCLSLFNSVEASHRLPSLTLRTSIFHSISVTVRNAHLAESQAELCAANVATYLSLSPSSASRGMLKYPQGIFGVPEVPLLACVSLGRPDSHFTLCVWIEE